MTRGPEVWWTIANRSLQASKKTETFLRWLVYVLLCKLFTLRSEASPSGRDRKRGNVGTVLEPVATMARAGTATAGTARNRGNVGSVPEPVATTAAATSSHVRKRGEGFRFVEGGVFGR